MNQCIKCGVEIPAGELFCPDCSLNPGSSLLGSQNAPARHPAPTGRMQAPQPVKRAVLQTDTPAKKRKKDKQASKGRAGLIVALVLVSMMLAATVGFLFWQYNDLKVERTRLETKEADMLLREKEKEELEVQLNEAIKQAAALQETISEKDSQISDLRTQLSGSQNSQTQSEFNLTNALTEMARLEEENQQLLLLEDELEDTIQSLTEDLEALDKELKDEKASAKQYKTKADFMDKYVVFVENNNSKVYHTYDCKEFSRSNFWAYSRKLAESNGFGPCEICGGKP